MAPIYKDSNKERLLNYMLISILPWFSKILERIIYKRLYYYSSEDDLLYSK